MSRQSFLELALSPVRVPIVDGVLREIFKERDFREEISEKRFQRRDKIHYHKSPATPGMKEYKAVVDWATR